MATLSAGDKQEIVEQLDVVQSWIPGRQVDQIEDLKTRLGASTLSAEEKQGISDELLVLATHVGGPRHAKVLELASRVLGDDPEEHESRLVEDLPASQGFVRGQHAQRADEDV